MLLERCFCFDSWWNVILISLIWNSTQTVTAAFVCVPLQLALEDPVHSVSLQQFVYEKLKAQQAMMGDQGFGVLMETVDTELVRQLQEFLQGLWITSMSLLYLTQTPLPSAPPPHITLIKKESFGLRRGQFPQLTPCIPFSISWVPLHPFFIKVGSLWVHECEAPSATLHHHHTRASTRSVVSSLSVVLTWDC